jgi:mono/diheme cytochrome c family protein
MLSPSLARLSRLLPAVLAAVALSVQAQPGGSPAASPTRGQLLYDAHCIECHNAQIHWRALSQASDWSSLVVQVNRWQAAAMLGWSGDDIVEVARYLNETIYKFPLPQERASR